MTWLLKLATGNPLTLLWIAAGIAVAAGSAGGFAAWKVQGWRLEAANLRTVEVQGQYDRFADGVKAAGVLAEAEAKAKAADDKKEKEKADAENLRTTANLRADIKRLRDDRASPGGGGLSAPAPSAGSPEKTCFDPAKLSESLRRLDEGILGLVIEGSQAVIDLDSAKMWAKPMDVSAETLSLASRAVDKKIDFSKESVEEWAKNLVHSGIKKDKQ